MFRGAIQKIKVARFMDHSVAYTPASISPSGIKAEISATNRNCITVGLPLTNAIKQYRRCHEGQKAARISL